MKRVLGFNNLVFVMMLYILTTGLRLKAAETVTATAVPAPAPDKSSELATAYEKEYSFLIKQKRALENSLAQFSNTATVERQKAEASVARLQDQQVALSRRLETLTESLEKQRQNQSDKSSEKDGALAAIHSAKNMLRENGLCQECKSNDSDFSDLSPVLQSAVAFLSGLSQVSKTPGQFFDEKGQKVEGDLIKIGQIGAFGLDRKRAVVLAPAGGGNLKAYRGSDGDVVTAPSDPFTRLPIGIFLYESLLNPAQELKVKNLVETISEGGRVGWIIVSLGILALAAVLYKFMVLTFAVKGQTFVEKKIDEAIAGKDLQSVLNFCKGAKVYSSQLMGSILAHAGSSAETLENAFNQGFIEETRKLDRFTMFITVVSSVAPLFGLLGTVMGMIETFDVITKVGTGNPKVLSAGIAEALIATMLGLLVAIPSLLAGSLLNAWASQIKNRLESMALKIMGCMTEETSAPV